MRQDMNSNLFCTPTTFVAFTMVITWFVVAYIVVLDIKNLGSIAFEIWTIFFLEKIIHKAFRERRHVNVCDL